MAVASYCQGVPSIVTLLCFSFLLISLLPSTNSHHPSDNSQRKRRIRRQTEVNYATDLQQLRVFPEDAADDTVLYDFNSIKVGAEAVSNFNFKVISNKDSNPQKSEVAFTVDDKLQLVFNSSTSRENRRRNYFDFEKFPKLTIIIEADPINSGKGSFVFYFVVIFI